MKITILCVGKLKERYWKMAIDEYSKRLSKYIKLEIIEVSDEKSDKFVNEANKNIIIQKEGKRLTPYLKDNCYIITLAILGEPLSSEKFANLIQTKMIDGVSNIVFVIGGSLGLSDDILEKAHFKLSFSSMTFPHQLMRIILIEQIYRVYKIINNEIYHK